VPSFHVTSRQQFDEMTPDRCRRTIEMGRARERFRRNTAAGGVESTVNGRFGERGEDRLTGERP